MRQVFSNLVRNAIEASSSGGEIRIRVSEYKRWNKPGKRSIWISIADHGVGIPKENIKKVFEAFFTTKALKGSGVGLWLSATIVNEHKGRLRMRSSDRLPQSGTCMTIMLPASASVAHEQTVGNMNLTSNIV
jgi:two-component system, NtrC family, sensor kinase